MSANGKYLLRRATINDIDFIVDVIISAEKGGTDKLGLSNIFGLSEQELRTFLFQMLEEEVDGCEFSISSFIVAECNGEPVSAFAGWIEGANEDELPSSMLKSNLIAYYFPIENIEKSVKNADAVKDLQVDRPLGTYQLEYAYTKPEHRGQNLLGRIIDEHCKMAKQLGKTVSKMYVHTFANNIPALKLYEKCGFVEVRRFVSSNPLAKAYYPYDEVVLYEKNI